jgi:hypothetical protein
MNPAYKKDYRENALVLDENYGSLPNEASR